jgi:hypothetical protein
VILVLTATGDAFYVFAKGCVLEAMSDLQSVGVKRAASSSDVQQLVEHLMLIELSKALGRTLTKATIPVGRSKISVDGFHREPHRVILAEAWAHVGKAKAAQVNKVRSDMLKMVLIKGLLKRSYPDLKVECYLAFADSIAAAVITTGRSWTSIAAAEFGIEARVVALTEEVIAKIKETQQRQDIRIADETG